MANHHVSPGEKLRTWGHSDFGKAWNRNLTYEDEPFIELMCGVFTDNQTDFSWIMPGEEKTFSQYFISYRDFGVGKNANKEAMGTLEFQEGNAVIKAYSTASYPTGKIILKVGQHVLLDETFDFHPATSYEKILLLPEGTDPQMGRIG